MLLNFGKIKEYCRLVLVLTYFGLLSFLFKRKIALFVLYIGTCCASVIIKPKNKSSLYFFTFAVL